MNLKELAKQYLLAKERYERAVRITIQSSEKLDKNLFWKILDDYRILVSYYLQKRSDAFRYAADDLMRRIQVEDKEYGVDDLLAFVKTYGLLKSTLFRRLREPLKNESNLGFLVDVLPIIGKEGCLRIIAGEIKSLDELVDLVHDHVELSCLCHAILLEENCVEQALEEGFSARLCQTFIDDSFLLELENVEDGL